jgi:predicted metal-dependent hydrolase
MHYELKRSHRTRSIRIRLRDDGALLVSAPLLVPRLFIDRFVQQSQSWIERQQQKLSLKQMANPTIDWKRGLVSIWGKLYTIRLAQTPQSDKVVLNEHVCLVRPVTGLESDMKKTLLSWLKRSAEVEIVKKVHNFSQKMDTECGQISFGQQSSRWGSCSHDNNLRFNWRLVHFPDEVVEYVIIHELAHTIHHNHSQAFWNVVAIYCPSWKEQRRFLKRQVLRIE